MFDLLMSADLLVGDVDGVAARIVEVFGFPEPRPSWVHDTPEARSKVWFLRPHLDRSNAPSTVEVIGPHPETGWSDQLRVIDQMQGRRPMKTHATVFAVPEVEPYVKRMDNLAIPYFLDPGIGGPLPFPKLWIGQQRNANGDTTYDGSYDSGLVVELIPTAPLLLPEAVEAPAAPTAEEGAAIRIASRSFVVDDLDAAVGVIEKTLAWQPERTIGADGAPVAAYRGRLPGSAALELMEPVGDGDARSHLAEFGPGAYRITFAVRGIDAAAGRLEERGVRYAFVEEGGSGARRIRVDPVSVNGLLFDLVDVVP